MKDAPLWECLAGIVGPPSEDALECQSELKKGAHVGGVGVSEGARTGKWLVAEEVGYDRRDGRTGVYWGGRELVAV